MFSIVKVARDQTRPGSLLARLRGRLDERPWELGGFTSRKLYACQVSCSYLVELMFRLELDVKVIPPLIALAPQDS